MSRWKIFRFAMGAVLGVSLVTGMRARTNGASEARTGSATPLVAPIAMPPAVVAASRPTLSEIVDIVLRERPTAAEMMSTGARSGEFPAGSDEAYVARMLAPHNSDRTLVNQIAAALVTEGRRRNVGTSLLVGVILTENPSLDPRAMSFVGARGLMQVMPFHAGNWGCGSRDLFDVESNICHGVAVLAENLAHARNLPQALLGYNGCVRGTNTPDCRHYPRAVYRRASFGE